jgi:hypothetical protein|tara:strand:+ start:457 stop:642 length:186 start_codon:yes stop_codon:yes gene_type:complete
VVVVAEELELHLQEDLVEVELVDQIQMIVELQEQLTLVEAVAVAVMLQVVHPELVAQVVQE